MVWNYRIVRDYDPDGTPHFTIREAYYDVPGGPATSITEGPSYPIGEDTAELRRDLCNMIPALTKKVIDAKTMQETEDLAIDILAEQLEPVLAAMKHS